MTKIFVGLLAIIFSFSAMSLIKSPIAHAQQTQNSLTVVNQVTNTNPQDDLGIGFFQLITIMVVCNEAGSPVSGPIGGSQQITLENLEDGVYRALSYGGYSPPGGEGGAPAYYMIDNPLPRLLCSGEVDSVDTIDIQIDEGSQVIVTLQGEPFLEVSESSVSAVNLFDVYTESSPGTSRIVSYGGGLTWDFIVNSTIPVAGGATPICLDDVLLTTDDDSGLELAPGTYSFNRPNFSDPQGPVCSGYSQPPVIVTVEPDTTYYIVDYFYEEQESITGLSLTSEIAPAQVDGIVPEQIPNTQSEQGNVNTPSPLLIRSGQGLPVHTLYILWILIVLTVVPSLSWVIAPGATIE